MSVLVLIVLVLYCETALHCSGEWGGRQMWKCKMQVWPCLVFRFSWMSFSSCHPPLLRCRCVVRHCISYFRGIWELFAHQPEVLCTLGRMLEVASSSAAVTLQYASVCLGLLWGLPDVFLPPLCPLPSRACNTSQPCSTLAGLLPPYVRRC